MCCCESINVQVSWILTVLNFRKTFTARIIDCFLSWCCCRNDTLKKFCAILRCCKKRFFWGFHRIWIDPFTTASTRYLLRLIFSLILRRSSIKTCILWMNYTWDIFICVFYLLLSLILLNKHRRNLIDLKKSLLRFIFVVFNYFCFINFFLFFKNHFFRNKWFIWSTI